MLDRLFPRQIDNAYRGRRLGLWLFVPILIVELGIGGNSMINPHTVAATADGIPVDSYGPAGAAQVISLFALLGFCRLLFALLGVLALIRYRAAIALIYLVFLALHLGNKVLNLAHPTVSSGAPSAGLGSAVVLTLLAMLLVGFALSLSERRLRRGEPLRAPPDAWRRWRHRRATRPAKLARRRRPAPGSSTMILYGNSASPFVRKTMAYMAEKDLKAEVKNVRFADPDPGFREASPFGKMPGFRDGDFAISDSTAIIAYLEAKYPNPPLIPLEPASRARAVWYEEFADTILIACMGKLFFNRIVAPRFLGQAGDLAAADKAETEEVPPLFDYIERVMPASRFLVDDRLTVADLAVASPFVNFAHLGLAPDAATHPKTAAFADTILARPSFAPIVAREKAFFASLP